MFWLLDLVLWFIYLFRLPVLLFVVLWLVGLNLLVLVLWSFVCSFVDLPLCLAICCLRLL